MLVLAGCLLIVRTGCMGVHSPFCIQKSMSIQHRQTYRLLMAVFLTASFKDVLPLFYKMCFVVLPFLSLHSISMSKHLNITFFLKNMRHINKYIVCESNKSLRITIYVSALLILVTCFRSSTPLDFYCL